MDWQVIAIIVIPLVSVILGAWLQRGLERKPNLIAYVGNISSFDVQKTMVYTHILVVRNSGKLAANNVRISHWKLPEFFQLSPALKYHTEDNEDGTKDIIIEKMVPSEQVTISYLYLEPFTINNIHKDIKSDEGYAKILSVFLSQQYPRWIRNSSAILIVMGVFATIYILFLLVLWLYKLSNIV